MKTESFYIGTKELQAFKKSCDKMGVIIASTEVSAGSRSKVTVLYISPFNLFYLGRHFQLKCK